MIGHAPVLANLETPDRRGGFLMEQRKMDLQEFELTDEPKAMPLLTREGLPTDVVIYVRGTHTADYKREMFKLTKKMGQLVKLSPKGELELDFSKVDPEIEMTLTAQRSALLVSGWEGFTSGGKPHQYSPEAATALLLKNEFIANQVIAFAGKQDNFFQQPAPASSSLPNGSENSTAD